MEQASRSAVEKWNSWNAVRMRGELSFSRIMRRWDVEDVGTGSRLRWGWSRTEQMGENEIERIP